MRIALTQNLEQLQEMKISFELRQELLQTMIQNVQHSIELLQSEVAIKPADLAPSIFLIAANLAKNVVKDSRVQQAVVAMLLDKDTQLFLVKHALELANHTDSSLSTLVARATVATFQTTSSGHIVMPGKIASTQAVPARVIEALQFPEKVKQQIEELDNLVQSLRASTQSNVEGLVRERIELSDSLEVATQYRHHVSICAKLLDLSLRLRVEQEEPILLSFFKEAAILERLTWQVSDRICKRFVSRIKGIRPFSQGREYRDGVVNTISEFVMVSMGVIDLQLFRISKAEVDQQAVLFGDQQIGDTHYESQGDDITSSLHRFGLNSDGVYYWSRWAIKGSKATKKTDQAVRAFMREIVADNTNDLLHALNYRQMVEDIKAAKIGRSGQDRQAAMLECLVSSLNQPSFLDYLKDKMTSQWFPALTTLLKHSGTSSNSLNERR